MPQLLPAGPPVMAAEGRVAGIVLGQESSPTSHSQATHKWEKKSAQTVPVGVGSLQEVYLFLLVTFLSFL